VGSQVFNIGDNSRVQSSGARTVSGVEMSDALAIPPEHLPIYRLEAEILALPQVEMPVEHQFCDGLYARTLHIPAGTVLTGAVHKAESFFIVRSGEIAVTTDHGVVHLRAGDISVTKPGTKRAGLALTDCSVSNILVNTDNETDPEKLWEQYTVPPPLEAAELLRELTTALEVN
jgi:mannose-6-phosphate isomerase-like protein (cupin superfamily)